MEKQPELWDYLPPERMLNPDEIFEQANQDLIQKLVENRRIERKSASFSGESLGEYICMWANTQPDGGIIALGISDDGMFEGCLSHPQAHLNKLEKAGYVYCPDAKLQTKQMPFRHPSGEMDFIILFRVKYHPDIVVKTVSGKVFVRIADSKCQLKRPEEIRELQADKGQVSFEQESCSVDFPSGFNESAITQFVSNVRKSRNLSIDLSTKEVLAVRHLGDKKGGSFVPNYACLLLFGKDPTRFVPGCKIRFQRFEGEEEKTGEEYNAVKDQIIEGTIPELIQLIEGVLDSQLRTFSPLDRRGKFFPMPEYPRDAWFEAIVNACVHRSYGNGMKNTPIYVKMFDDRLIVESPGPFPPFITPENIYDMHLPRNPKQMDALFYLDFTRLSHEGARRIRDSMAKMNLPKPEFEQSQSGHMTVRVTLRNNIKQRRAWIDKDVSRLVSEAIAADLTENERRALNWIAEHGKATVSDAQKLLSLSWQSAQKVLAGLARKRICQYVRFKPHEKDVRDQRAYYRLRTALPLPEGAFEAVVKEEDDPDDEAGISATQS